jgi:hypothetical protein
MSFLQPKNLVGKFTSLFLEVQESIKIVLFFSAATCPAQKTSKRRLSI